MQTVANLIERRLFETKENKRLLEKSQRIEAILASLQASGAEPEQLTGGGDDHCPRETAARSPATSHQQVLHYHCTLITTAP
nr:DNA-directed RNA polymerase III subunit RPC3-like [Oncorhynchus nerka]